MSAPELTAHSRLTREAASPQMPRVYLRRNGSAGGCVAKLPGSFVELLALATAKLGDGLTRVFAASSDEILPEDFELIEAEDVLYLSKGEDWVAPPAPSTASGAPDGFSPTADSEGPPPAPVPEPAAAASLPAPAIPGARTTAQPSVPASRGAAASAAASSSGKRKEPPPGWLAEKHEAPSGTYTVYVGPKKKKVRSIAQAWREHEAVAQAARSNSAIGTANGGDKAGGAGAGAGAGDGDGASASAGASSGSPAAIPSLKDFFAKGSSFKAGSTPATAAEQAAAVSGDVAAATKPIAGDPASACDAMEVDVSECKDDDDSVFEVAGIVDKRSADGESFEYLVVWRGYAESENTWEPAANILDSSLLEVYDQRQAHLASLDAAALLEVISSLSELILALGETAPDADADVATLLSLVRRAEARKVQDSALEGATGKDGAGSKCAHGSAASASKAKQAGSAGPARSAAAKAKAEAKAAEKKQKEMEKETERMRKEVEKKQKETEKEAERMRKEAEKKQKEMEKEAERMRKEAEKEEERLEREAERALKAAEKAEKEAEKEAERLAKEAERKQKEAEKEVERAQKEAERVQAQQKLDQSRKRQSITNFFGGFGNKAARTEGGATPDSPAPADVISPGGQEVSSGAAAPPGGGSGAGCAGASEVSAARSASSSAHAVIFVRGGKEVRPFYRDPSAVLAPSPVGRGPSCPEAPAYLDELLAFLSKRASTQE